MSRDLTQVLGATSYPGRGIIMGKTPDSRYMVIAYFIMGRSENSRNRIFEETEDGIRTKAFDESKVTDPSLILYTPVRRIEDRTIVTNGDQTDTIYEEIAQGGSFENALRRRTFEPDAPNYTPRISGLADPARDSIRLSILKSGDGTPAYVRRFFYEYTGIPAGVGYLIHTYQGDGDPLPSFAGEPVAVALPDGLNSFTKAVWDGLNPDNRVSLFTHFISFKTGETDTRILNKHE